VRILVTGGAGFIGSHLVDHHLAEGHEVVIVDDFSTGSHDNIAHHGTERLRVVVGKVEDPAVLDDAFDRIDLVYHLAAAVGVFEILRRPLECLRTNLDATEAIFDRATQAGVRTVFTSTSEVYGKNGKANLTETDDSIYGPTTASRWLYAVSKATDEFLALANHRQYGFPVTIVRLFNTTGPRQTGAYGMVVPRFVQQALSGSPLTVFGDGTQTRSFTNVHDAVEALVRIGRTPEALGRVVNIGQPSEISILELARRIIDVTGSRSEIELVPYGVAYEPGFEDMRRRVPDVTLLRELIGYVPDTTIDVTIRQIVEAVEAGQPMRLVAAPSGT
jgi:UDP-glucose 4-epimerase